MSASNSRIERGADAQGGSPAWLRPVLEALTAITTSAAPLENKLQSVCTTLMEEVGATGVFVLDTTGEVAQVLCFKLCDEHFDAYWQDAVNQASLLKSMQAMTVRSHLSHVIQIDRGFLVDSARFVVACCPMVAHGVAIGSLVCLFNGECTTSDPELNQLRVCARVLAMAIGSSEEFMARQSDSLWQRRYTSLTRTLPGTSVILTPKGTISSLQEGVESLPGSGDYRHQHGLASTPAGEAVAVGVANTPDQTRRQVEAFRQALEGRPAKCHVNVHTPEGVRILEHRYEPVGDHRGVTGEVAMFARDVTNVIHLKQSVRDLRERDPVTGTLTVCALMDRSRSRMDTCVDAPQMSHPQVFMSIEVDGSATGVQLLGNEAFEELLQAISARISKCLPGVDSIARRGERNFLATFEMPNSTRSIDVRREAMDVASQVINHLREPIVAGRKEYAMSVTVGYSIFPEDGRTPELLFRAADIAAANAQRAGRNCALPFKSEMARDADDRTQLETRLYRAVENEEFELAFQPKVRISDGAVAGVEALLRWHGSEPVSPAKFIPVAEECGLISYIGEWALRQACRTAKKWADQGLRLPISVNVSTRQFHDNEFHNVVAEVLSDTQCDPSLLDLEVTEGVMFSDPEAAILSFTLLKEMGVSISIDDFGMGFSSLSYLKSLPADAVKIDRTFIQGLPHDTNNAAIARAIVAMAKAMNMTVVAEGVEDAQCLKYLGAIGCDEAQGYFFAKPLFESDLMAWLSSYKPEAVVALVLPGPPEGGDIRLAAAA